MSSKDEVDPPECLICLSKIKNPCVMSSCEHRCCFSCVSEWCKVNASCPACKRPITWLMDKNDELHAIEAPPPPRERELDPLFVVSSEDSMGDFIVPDGHESEPDIEWVDERSHRQPARKRGSVDTRRRSKRTKL